MGKTSRPRHRRILIKGLILTPLGEACARTRPHPASAPARSARDAKLDLVPYQRPDGAITTTLGGRTMDPYFVMKGLLCARRLGLDLGDLALRFAAMLLPFQKSNGSFDRFCLGPDRWVACASADADDSTLALWIQLLTGLSVLPPGAPASNAHRKLADSLSKALRGLDGLRTRSGTYNLSASVPVQLLMDNCEVFESLAQVSTYFLETGEKSRALSLRTQSDALRTALLRQFLLPAENRLTISSQKQAKSSFYPDAVAQLYPFLANIRDPALIPAAIARQWFSQHGEAWLSGTADEYPWGLMALAFQEMGRRDIVDRWLAVATPLRHSQRWNVLEECLWQGLQA